MSTKPLPWREPVAIILCLAAAIVAVPTWQAWQTLKPSLTSQAAAGRLPADHPLLWSFLMNLRVGQDVHYWPEPDVEKPLLGGGDQCLAAKIAHINGDGTVNLMVLTDSGDPRSRCNVLIVTPGTVPPADKSYCFLTGPDAVKHQSESIHPKPITAEGAGY